MLHFFYHSKNRRRIFTFNYMSFNYTLETFTFRSSDDIDKIYTIKHFYSNRITQV